MHRLLSPLAVLLAAVLLAGMTGCDSDSTSGGPPPDDNDRAASLPQSVPDTAYTTLDGGLKVYNLVAGDGATATDGQRVTVHYTGWLRSDSTKFDSSRDRGQPFSFRLGAGEVIQGWDRGVRGMQVGGTRQLVIPPELAYGSRGAGGGTIPPDATLIFEVELLGVESP